VIGNEEIWFTRAAGDENSGGDRFKQVSLFAVLGSGRWRQQGRWRQVGKRTYRLCPPRIEELDGYEGGGGEMGIGESPR
jgi:hypothetical protein